MTQCTQPLCCFLFQNLPKEAKICSVVSEPMTTLIIIVAIVGYGFTFLSLFRMNLVYSKYWKLHSKQQKTEVDDPEHARVIEFKREILPAALHSYYGWAALLSAVGTTVLLVILAIIALIQSFG